MVEWLHKRTSRNLCGYVRMFLLCRLSSPSLSWNRNQAHGSYAENAWKCPNSLNIRSTHTNTPIICTSNDPNLFYRNRGLDPDASNNGEILADRIRNVTAPYEPPFFVLIYGGLNWQPGSTSGTLEFWTLLESVMENLGEQYEAIGADEMARLSRDVCTDGEMNSSSWVCSKNKTDN